MKRTYEVRDRADKRAIREFLKREGQFLLPMLELVEQTEVAIDEVIQVMGRATIEAVLEMSAEGVAGVESRQVGHERKTTRCVWPAGWCGLPVGPEGACGAATAQAPGRWGGWRGRGAGVRSDAETGRRGGSDARGPDGGGEQVVSLRLCKRG